MSNKKTKRITKVQSKIFEDHIEAWKSNKFSNVNTYNNAASLVNSIKNGDTSKALWDAIIDRHLSVFQQLVLNADILHHMPQSTKLLLRVAWKNTLNSFNII